MLSLNKEKSIFGQGYKLIGGIDEAGRGPLAGPVVAACVLVAADFNFEEASLCWPLNIINDSKRLTKKKREEAFAAIKENFEVGVGICDAGTIDRVNILQATFLAMKKALGALKKKPDFIILDGQLAIPNLSVPQEAIIDGDAKIFSIAAASIIAKVTRDRLMRDAHEKYPDYGFDKHKGYGTKLHKERLKKFGPCPIHRRSFAPVRRHVLRIT